MRSNGAQEIERKVLVVGGTGKTGRRVADRLRAQGVSVRVGSRSGTPAFDWEDRSTWAPALAGMGAAYVTYYPDSAVPGAAEAIGSFSQLAMEKGTRRLVLLSGRGEEEAQRSEEMLKQSGADWTVLRCSFFMQNFSEGFLLEPMLAGELALPADRVVEPFVDLDDVAAVAVAALTERRGVGRVYELTGPRLLRFDEAVAEVQRATGRTIRYVPLTIEEFSRGMAEDGVPDEVASALEYIFSEVLDGRNEHVTDGVESALGRPARDFSDFARDAAASGAWSASRIAA